LSNLGSVTQIHNFIEVEINVDGVTVPNVHNSMIGMHPEITRKSS